MDSISVDAKDLTRTFGALVAVDHIGFRISQGEIFGFLGPNGAGKSTTMRMLCGILSPTSGSATVLGYDIVRDPEKIKNSIGYMSQRFSLYHDLTVRENLLFYGRIYGLEGGALDRRIHEVLDETGLEPREKDLAGVLSGGLKQKLALANAILHEPKLLFLDEPTAGIDPMSRRELWELFYRVVEQGVTLFVTTHYMEEAERCHQIAFIDHGRILLKGSPQDLKEHGGKSLIEVECVPLMKASRCFKKVSGLKAITAYGSVLHLTVQDTGRASAEVKQIAEENGIRVLSIKPATPSLEDIFTSVAEPSHAAN